ncbi:unnamed protein product [Blepharisma stoltei]|uniref:Uncharacterized protein n=1 Tax=Blepharisma stoltei TaxID=1481888 RepID=A0AAU9IR49_9CILI|nr:unnamed protein product [Blepharisma stoltei]
MGCGGSKNNANAVPPKVTEKETFSSGDYDKGKPKNEEIPDEEAVVLTNAKVLKKKPTDFRDNLEEPKAPAIISIKKEPVIPTRIEAEEPKFKSTTVEPTNENIPINKPLAFQPPPKPPSKLPPLTEKPNFPNMKPEFDFDFLDENEKSKRGGIDSQRKAADKEVIVDQLLEEFNDI